MTETKKSLKWFFIVIGIIGLWNIAGFGAINGDIVMGIFLSISVISGGIFLYIGVKLDELLKKSQKFINKFLIAELAFLIIDGLYNITKGVLVGIQIFSLVIGVAITIYLINSVKRLAGEKQVSEQK